LRRAKALFCQRKSLSERKGESVGTRKAERGRSSNLHSTAICEAGKATACALIDIEAALRQGLAVIPVVVYGAVMPSCRHAAMPPAEALPVSLGQLQFLNAAPVRLDPDFATDVRRLCDSLDRLVMRPTVA
jgi:hypothetical protein